MSEQDTRTITVKGSFDNDVTLTFDEYAGMWRNHAAQLFHITVTLEDHYIIVDLMKAVERMIVDNFDKLYDEQHKESVA